MGKGRYMDGFQLLTEYQGNGIMIPVGSAVAIARGDVITISSGYAALATTLAVATGIFYVAMSENTAAEAVTNGTVSCLAVPILSTGDRYMVPVKANTVLVQATHVGYHCNLDGSEDGITNAATVTVDNGFRIEEIDISAAALAIETYGYAIGRFVALSETT